MRMILGLACACSLMVRPASAFEIDIVRDLSICAGRLAAQNDFAYVTPAQTPYHSQTADSVVLAEIIFAAASAENGRQVYDWRISGRRAQAALLSRAITAQDNEEALWAWTQASTHVEHCLDFIKH